MDSAGSVTVKLTGGPLDGDCVIMHPHGSVRPPSQWAYFTAVDGEAAWHIYESEALFMAAWPNCDRAVRFNCGGTHSLDKSKVLRAPRESEVERFIDGLRLALDPDTREQFCPMAQLSLKRSMQWCGMIAYPKAIGNPDGDRVDGRMVCETCNRDYFSHPRDWRVIGCGNVPFLNVLCDGRRVKL